MTCIPCQNKHHLLTNSRRNCFLKCPRMHFYQYEVGLHPIKKSEPLRFGNAYHTALEAFYKTEGEFEGKVQAGIVAIFHCYENIPAWADPYEWACEMHKCFAMFTAHQNYYREVELEVVATEQSFKTPLQNPMTGNVSPIWKNAGKVDNIVRDRDGSLKLMEFKTTSESDISEGSDYVRRLRIDSQISHYILACREMGLEVEPVVIYDVVRKPKHSPLRKTENIRLKKDGTPYADTRLEDEAPEVYGKRCYDAIMSDPDRYMRRFPVVRLESDLDEHQKDIYAIAKSIREAQRLGRWPRNTDSCMTLYGTCKYFDLCTNQVEVERGTLAPEGFEFVDNVHPELN